MFSPQDDVMNILVRNIRVHDLYSDTNGEENMIESELEVVKRISLKSNNPQASERKL